jgi:hypothetical protein
MNERIAMSRREKRKKLGGKKRKAIKTWKRGKRQKTKNIKKKKKRKHIIEKEAEVKKKSINEK